MEVEGGGGAKKRRLGEEGAAESLTKKSKKTKTETKKKTKTKGRARGAGRGGGFERGGAGAVAAAPSLAATNSKGRSSSSSSSSSSRRRRRRQAPGKEGDYDFRKRVPLRPEAGPNDIYVTRKRKLAALVQRALKVLDPDTYRLGQIKTVSRLVSSSSRLLDSQLMQLDSSGSTPQEQRSRTAPSSPCW